MDVVVLLPLRQINILTHTKKYSFFLFIPTQTPSWEAASGAGGIFSEEGTAIAANTCPGNNFFYLLCPLPN
ncbi:MAG: hypothetical protein IT238_09080 [Bacteroidia bacterium]|nr:hypothetical protein [Bacteroidia bacterium]